MASVNDLLFNELAFIDGFNGSDPETGLAIDPGEKLSTMTNRLFGAPFQLLDSVDHRFPNLNKEMGSEYLRNFLLNAPILYIHPGLPKFTGGDTNIADETLQNIFLGQIDNGPGGIMMNMAKGLIFGRGGKLQKRMYGFRQTYIEYMMYVNYMCRSVAEYMGLTSDPRWGTFMATNGGNLEFVSFSDAPRWENYRMMSGYVESTTERFKRMIDIGWDAIGDGATNIWDSISGMPGELLDLIQGILPGGNPDATLDEAQRNAIRDKLNSLESQYHGTATRDDLFNSESELTAFEKMDAMKTSVAFMVEPISFSESFRNTTRQSELEGMVDKLRSGLGTEMAFITGSRTDIGALQDLLYFVGNTSADAMTQIADLIEPMTGGFINGLFRGAVNSIKGEKMIYPDIYDYSESDMNYRFSMTLTSAYGDNYNYYMTIIVPILHLIALANPRLVSSNSMTSPFLVQAYIPGICTCQLGMISDLTITKAPEGNRVSVNGFPLTVKVDFTIKELYNAMAISPANDPSSFLYNETLNDYLINISGLVPSNSTYVLKQKALFANLEDYFTIESIFDQMIAGSGAGDWVEGILTPVSRR